MEASIHWLEPKKTPLWIGVLVVALSLGAPLLMEASFPPGDTPSDQCMHFSVSVVMWSFSAAMLLLFIPLLFFIRGVVNNRLGFRNEWVLVERRSGPVLMARDEDLTRVNNGFIIEGVTIPTGNPRFTLYTRKDLETWLHPRLARGKDLGPMRQLSWQWQHRRGQFILMITAIIAGLALIAAMEGGWMEAQFKDWLENQPECRGLLDAPGDGEPSPGSTRPTKT